MYKAVNTEHEYASITNMTHTHIHTPKNKHPQGLDKQPVSVLDTVIEFVSLCLQGLPGSWHFARRSTHSLSAMPSRWHGGFVAMYSSQLVFC